MTSPRRGSRTPASPRPGDPRLTLPGPCRLPSVFRPSRRAAAARLVSVFARAAATPRSCQRARSWRASTLPSRASSSPWRRSATCVFTTSRQCSRCLACILLGVERVEFALVIFAASFVIATEMLNTAVEATIDVATTAFNPLAKVAKDVAAGAVLIATFNAMCTAYLVFSPKIIDPSAKLLVAVRDTSVNLTFVALVVTFLGTVALKVITGRRGTPLRGGFPSGHAAIAFAAWMAITFVTAGADYATLASSLAFLLALLVSHTRVESGVHTWGEVAAGALFGSLVTLVIFQLAAAAR